MWGKPVYDNQCTRYSRSTPTRVGKTLASGLFRVVLEVHPHACGENVDADNAAGAFGGPPPRVWGKLQCLSPSIRPERSTPTRVGKTLRPRKNPITITVHPHACGENDSGYYLDRFDNGPPPRVWGKRTTKMNKSSLSWSTPTRVGKTLHDAPNDEMTAVHPHACGENVVWGALPPPPPGPPPRVWGKRICAGDRRRTERSTPTRVGKTQTD